jgi:hypothetical protein
MIFRLVALAVLIVFVPGCGPARPPQSEAEIAAEIAKVPKQHAGLWSMHFELSAFSSTGLPEPATARLRRDIEARGRLGQVVCFTPAMVDRKFAESLRHADGSICEIQNFHSDGITYDALLSCKGAGGFVGEMDFAGSTHGDSQQDRATIVMKRPGQEAVSVSYQMLIDSRRTKDCPAA